MAHSSELLYPSTGWRLALYASISQFTGNEHDGFVIIIVGAQGGMVDAYDHRPVILSAELGSERIAAPG